MTDKEKTTKILADVCSITNPDCLRVIQKTAFEHGKTMRRQQADVETALWKIDDEVQMLPEHRTRKPYDAKGTIDKINKVKMTIDFGRYGKWNIPKAMLMKTK